MTSSSSDPAEECFEFVGDITDYWSYTQVRDWVLLKQGMTRTALHLYLLLRSMVSETARRTGGGLRRMSVDQLCFLLPGVNDKPASPTMVKDALRLLDEHGLVVNPEGGRLLTSTGKGGIQNTFRRYQVNDLPPNLYEGWRNVWDKLDAYRPDWRENPPKPPTHTRTDEGVQQNVGRISDPRTDQQRDEEPPGHFDGRKSDQPRRKSDQPGRKKSASKPVTSNNVAPKEGPQRSSSLSSRQSLGYRAGTEREQAAPNPGTDSPGGRDYESPGADTAADQGAEAVVQAYVAAASAAGVIADRRDVAGIRQDAAGLLAEVPDCTPEWLAQRAAEMPANRWSDLRRHVAKCKKPMRAPRKLARSGPCSKCMDSGWLEDENGMPAGKCDCRVLVSA